MNRRTVIIAVVVLAVIFLVIGMLSGKKSDKQAAVATAASEGQSASQQTNNAVTAQQLYEEAKNFEKEGDLLKTKGIYQQILSNYSDYENIEKVQKELETLNIKLIFTNTPSPNSVIYKVKSGDTLGELAKKYGTTIELIMARNNLKNYIIRIGQQLSIWTGEFNIFVDKSQNILMLKQGDEIIKVYHVSTGSNNSTPVGEFKITSKLVDPVWFNRGVVVPPESPENVLGSRWLGFDIPGYGIHGTVEPETIGHQVTAGCVRMRNEEVEELYSMIPLGVKVDIVD